MRIFIIICLILLSSITAEAKMFTVDVELPLGYNNTEQQIRQELELQAREDIASQCCVYIQSFTTTNNGLLLNDEIKSIVVGYMKETNKTFSKYIKEEVFYISCHLEADVDEQKSYERLNELIKERFDNNPDNYYKLANNYFDKGEFKTAMEYYQKAKDGGCIYADLYSNMSLCAFYTATTKEDFAYAKYLFEYSIERFPYEPIAYLTAGTYLQLSNVPMAIKRLKRAIELDPTLIMAYVELVCCYDKLAQQHVDNKQYDLANTCLKNKKEYCKVVYYMVYNNHIEELYDLANEHLNKANAIVYY